MSKDTEDFWGLFLTLVFLGAGVFLIISALFFVPVAAVMGSPFLLLLAWLRSPKHLERQARKRTLALYETALAAIGGKQLSNDVAWHLNAHLPGNTPESVVGELTRIGHKLFDSVGVFSDLPPVPPVCNSVEGARYRDQLIRIANVGKQSVPKEVAETLSIIFGNLVRDIPKEESALSTELMYFVHDLPQTVERIVNTLADVEACKPLMEVIERNYQSQDWVVPTKYKGDDVVNAYLRGTALVDLFAIPVPVSIPEKRRFEHTHIVAQIGHGKTQSLQFLIAEDLKKVETGDATVIVIDSQGELIRNLAKLKQISSTDVVWVNPRDIEFPPALNLFDQSERTYTGAEQEQLTNATIELYEFIMGGIFGADLTSKQGVAFRYVIRLILTIPGATIQTLLEVFQHPEEFQDAIDKLGNSARSFFEEEFNSSQFKETRRQVIRRIYTILENRTLERMFAAESSKLDLFTEMNEGKLILIDTAKDMLKEEGAKILGRFFVAKIVQAAQERALTNQRKPVYVYVDEAQDYFDDKTEVFLSQLRKYNVGGTFAHQYLDQVPAKLLSAFMANTSTKMIGGVSVRDARVFAPELRRDPEFIASQPTGTFVTMIRGVTKKALPVKFPFFVVENMEQRDQEQMKMLIEWQRYKYCRDLNPPEEPETPPEDDFEPESPQDPPKPTGTAVTPKTPGLDGEIVPDGVETPVERNTKRLKQPPPGKSYEL